VRLGPDPVNAAEQFERLAAARVRLGIAHPDRLAQRQRVRGERDAEQHGTGEAAPAPNVGECRGPEHGGGRREEQHALKLHELQRHGPDEHPRACHANVNLACRHRQRRAVDVCGIGDRAIGDQRRDVLARSVAERVPPCIALERFTGGKRVALLQRGTIQRRDPLSPANVDSRLDDRDIDQHQREEDNRTDRDPDAPGGDLTHATGPSAPRAS
jgi:hypothetical protein